MPFRSFGLPGGFSKVFPIPTVARDLTSGQWAALSDEIKQYYHEVCVNSINEFTMRVARASREEAPLGPRGEDHPIGEGLRESQRNPNNDVESKATVEHPVAYISYDTIYAHVQHEGMAIMVHKHPIIPAKNFFFERTDIEEVHTIEWRAENYTTPGTKDHYLSDPAKRMMPQMQTWCGEYVRVHLGLF
jgi:hypothetical protein